MHNKNNNSTDFHTRATSIQALFQDFKEALKKVVQLLNIVDNWTKLVNKKFQTVVPNYS